MHTQATGSVCNGDSGSGFFVEQNDVRYYVGTTGNGVGISNCQSDGSIKMDPAGGMSWFPAPFKFLDLIESAEKFVAEEKKKEFAQAEEARLAAELKAKQEAEAKAKAEEEARARAEAELKAKQEAEAKAKAEEEAKARAEAEAKAKLEAAKKKTTITCVKGKLTKKVTAVRPKCPSGYKKK
jgi:polyribonucleotide nucleotidyltransferase